MPQNHISDNLASYFNVFEESLSKPQFSHFQSWNLGILHGKAQGSKISSQFSDKSETSVTRFLSQSSWDHHELNRQRIVFAKNILQQKYQKYVPLIIDDTIFEKYGKKLPGIGWHWSHTDNAVVWGQSLVTSHMMAGDCDIPLFVDLYHKHSGQSKIDLAIGQIHQFRQLHLPDTTTGVVVTDTWYGCKDIINESLNNGFELVTMLKSNRKVKVQGIDTWLSIRDISAKLEEHSLHHVTVDGVIYRFSQVTGTIHGIGGRTNKILLVQQYSDEKKSWSSFKYLLSTDTKMRAWTMIFLYRKRWKIETFYDFGKNQLKMADTRVLKELALLRFILLLFCSYTYLALRKFDSEYFENYEISYYQLQNQVIDKCQTQLIRWVYIQGQHGRPLTAILSELRLVEISA